MQQHKPIIQYKAIAELRQYQKNPRKNDHAVPAVAASIQEFGFKVPIIIDKYGVIIAGHTRFKAAKKLGFATVPVIVADDLNEDQIKAFRIIDNKTAELAEWDPHLLEKELSAIDFDMEQFGFIEEIISPDNFDTDFELPDGEKDEIETVSFVFAQEQSDIINGACDTVKKEVSETFGNTHEKSNQLYEIVRQWSDYRVSQNEATE
jgi:hypothetical protein